MKVFIEYNSSRIKVERDTDYDRTDEEILNYSLEKIKELIKQTKGKIKFINIKIEQDGTGN